MIHRGDMRLLTTDSPRICETEFVIVNLSHLRTELEKGTSHSHDSLFSSFRFTVVSISFIFIFWHQKRKFGWKRFVSLCES